MDQRRRGERRVPASLPPTSGPSLVRVSSESRPSLARVSCEFRPSRIRASPGAPVRDRRRAAARRSASCRETRARPARAGPGPRAGSDSITGPGPNMRNQRAITASTQPAPAPASPARDVWPVLSRPPRPAARGRPPVCWSRPPVCWSRPPVRPGPLHALGHLAAAAAAVRR